MSPGKVCKRTLFLSVSTPLICLCLPASDSPLPVSDAIYPPPFSQPAAGFLNPSWRSLLNGHGEVRASLAPAVVVIGGSMVTPPSGVISNAELIMEVIESPTSVRDGEIVCRGLPCEFELSQNYPNPFNV